MKPNNAFLSESRTIGGGDLAGALPVSAGGAGVGAAELIPHHSASVVQSTMPAASDSVGRDAIAPVGRRCKPEDERASSDRSMITENSRENRKRA